MRVVKFEVKSGCSITKACRDAARLATDRNTQVKFAFNGIELEATPVADPDAIEKGYWEKVKVQQGLSADPQKIQEFWEAVKRLQEPTGN